MKKLIIIVNMLLITYSAVGQNFQDLRKRMVRTQIEARGIRDKATLDAMRKVERHLFVPPEYQKYAYDDTPLPIGYDQTISQPYIVAHMTELLQLKPNDRVLEIGTGSGYQAAVLAEVVDEVYTIEIVEALGRQTKSLMEKLGYRNVKLIIGDGYKGYKEKAPFDAIIVTAAAERIPAPLILQLKEGGRMIIPVGPAAGVQNLMLLQKKKGKIIRTNFGPVRFVPFTREGAKGKP